MYGANDKGAGKFYDTKSNALNVAFSQVKDSFIVLGNTDFFGWGASGSPVGILRRKLKPVEEATALSVLEGR